MDIVVPVDGQSRLAGNQVREFEMKRNIIISATIVALGIATAGGLAVAKQTGVLENDAVSDLAKAKVSLGQAVTAAEAQAGGKATLAKLDDENGAIVFNVEVVTADSKVFDVKVSAADGKVLSSKADLTDRAREDKDD